MGSTFTMYGAWDYSNHFGLMKKVHTRWYTSSIDIYVIPPKAKRFLNGSAKFRGRLWAGSFFLSFLFPFILLVFPFGS